MTLETRARIKVDAMLAAAEWVVQSRDELNLDAVSASQCARPVLFDEAEDELLTPRGDG